MGNPFGWSYPAGAADDMYAPYNQNQDDEGFELLAHALQDRSTGRWRWDCIDCCLTGKDADLEPWGQQGIELIDVTEDEAMCIAHIGVTICGDDACLNVPLNATEEEAERLQELYLEFAEELSLGEWDGDSWYNLTSIDFTVPLVNNAEGELLIQETAEAIIAKGAEVLEPIEGALIEQSLEIDIAAGWKQRNPSGNIVPCPEGEPGPESLWYQLIAVTPAKADNDR